MIKKGFKGVFGNPDEVEKHSLPAVSEFCTCDYFHYFVENPDEILKTTDDLVILFLGRLDNALDLSIKLQMPDNSVDLDLVIRAYELIGESCTEHFIGDFSFVIFNRKERKLLLAKDQIGVKPLFYLEKSGCLFFATSIADLVSLLNKKEPLNREYIAIELLNYQQEVEDTFYENIKRLKPAHTLTFGDNKILVLKQYWELKTMDLSHLKSDQEVYDLLRKTLLEAISCRTRKADQVGCQLSGGLDSSAIAVLLSRMIDKTRLHTYSFVLNEETKKYTESGIDEKGTQQIVIEYASLIPENHHPIANFHFKTVFEEFESTLAVNAGAANSNCIWQESMFKQAAEQNRIDVMFSGFPGDEGISNSGGLYYYDYLGKVNIKALASLFLSQPLPTTKKILLYFFSFLRGSYKIGYRKIQKSRNLLHANSEYHKKLKDNTFKFYSTFKKYLKAGMLSSHTCLRAESEGLYAGKYGIETVYPLADIRLLQLVYSLPARFFKPDPFTRPVFRNLCKGILPEEVRLQPKFNGAKTLAFADYWILNKYESLEDYNIEDRLGMFVDADQFKSKGLANEFRMKRRLVNLKELDYLINRNWPD